MTDLDWTSDFMRGWQREKEYLEHLGQKYLDNLGNISKKEIKEDLSNVRRIRDKYNRRGNVPLVENVKPYYNMLKRLSGKKGDISTKIDDIARKNTDIVLPYVEDEIILEERVNEVEPPKRNKTAHNIDRPFRKKPQLHSPKAQEEWKSVMAGEAQFDSYLKELLEDRLDETVEFGKEMNVTVLENYLKNLSPEWELLHFDSLLAITQQYALSHAPIVNQKGTKAGGTGFNLAFFGAPGSGKTFAIQEMIEGNSKYDIPAHGLPGLNRQCGTMTPAFFLAIGEAYQGRRFNFIVPEFNQWFKYDGMVDNLKRAMEQGTIESGNMREVIPKYNFDSYFSVNYNTTTKEEGFEVTITDPNFSAIEDRMLCNLHKMTPERYNAVADSACKIESGEIDFNLAGKIRDHLTLVYAIESNHPSMQGQFPLKKILKTAEVDEKMGQIRHQIIDQLGGKQVPFSSRLERRAKQLAYAMSLIGYFQEDEMINVGSAALEHGQRFYVQEAVTRSAGQIDGDYIVRQLEL
jgi:hypothetical protein